MSLIAVAWYSHLLNAIIIVLGLMLMLIVLIQRGKGGGLAGAFGGAGGSSAFGSRTAGAGFCSDFGFSGDCANSTPQPRTMKNVVASFINNPAVSD